MATAKRRTKTDTEERKRARIVTKFGKALQSRADQLRVVAAQLRVGEDESKGGIRVFHAAARIERIANELCKGGAK